MKKSQFNPSKTSIKIGTASMIVISMITFHLCLMFLFSDNSKTHSYFLYKVKTKATAPNLG